ncbi:MAG: hypothetical protein P8N52_03725 [Crocinitomicaceae bacterium]|nr:hypothetical protein [Crocinitomicaceae bacterium]
MEFCICGVPPETALLADQSEKSVHGSSGLMRSREYPPLSLS